MWQSFGHHTAVADTVCSRTRGMASESMPIDKPPAVAESMAIDAPPAVLESMPIDASPAVAESMSIDAPTAVDDLNESLGSDMGV